MFCLAREQLGQQCKRKGDGKNEKVDSGGGGTEMAAVGFAWGWASEFGCLGRAILGIKKSSLI